MINTKKSKHVVVLCHPEPDSFNAAVAAKYCAVVEENGQEAVLRDLYRMKFDPVLQANEQPGSSAFLQSPHVAHELDIIADAAYLVLVYPIWFGTPPAMLKGYIDRVVGSGVTPREVQDRAAQGVLRGKRMLSITTSGAREIWLDEQAQIESLKNVMSRYLFHAFGIKYGDHLQFGGIVEGFPENFIQQNLRDVKDRAKRICGVIEEDRLVLADATP